MKPKEGQVVQAYAVHVVPTSFVFLVCDLFPLGFVGYDIILGIDWLEKYEAVLNCERQSVTLGDEMGAKGGHIMWIGESYYDKLLIFDGPIQR